MSVKHAAYLIIIILFTGCRADKQERLDRLVAEYHAKGEFNGAILISEGDNIICDTVVGYKDLHFKALLTPETPFYIASVSKAFTALAVMQLKEQGKLGYDNAISAHLAGLPTFAENITIRQLLTHTSGLPDYEKHMPAIPGRTNRDVLDWLAGCTHSDFKPGERFEYNNTGYVLLALIIENVSGLTYSGYLHENIFAPAGMSHTFVCGDPAPACNDRAIGYGKEGQPDDYNSLVTGAGGIFSTTKDLLSWLRELDNGLFVSQEELQAAYSPATLNDGTRSGYGFGWYITGSGENIIVLSHAGRMNGFRSLVWRDTQKKISIIILSNRGNALPLEKLVDDILNIL